MTLDLSILEEIEIDTDPNLLPVASKPYPLPPKHYKFVKEEFENLLEAGLIKRFMSPYAISIIVSLERINQEHP